MAAGEGSRTTIGAEDFHTHRTGGDFILQRLRVGSLVRKQHVGGGARVRRGIHPTDQCRKFTQRRGRGEGLRRGGRERTREAIHEIHRKKTAEKEHKIEREGEGR